MNHSSGTSPSIGQPDRNARTLSSTNRFEPLPPHHELVDREQFEASPSTNLGLQLYAQYNSINAVARVDSSSQNRLATDYTVRNELELAPLDHHLTPELDDGETRALSIAVSHLLVQEESDGDARVARQHYVTDATAGSLRRSCSPCPDQVSQPEGSYTVWADQVERPPSQESRRLRIRSRRFSLFGGRSRRPSFDEPTNLLRERLQQTIHPSCGLQKRFIPASAFPNLLSEDAVAAELLRHKLFGILKTTSDEVRLRQVNTIIGRSTSGITYRKILAILLLIDRPGRIASFIENGVSDQDLPLQTVRRKKDPSGATFKLRCGRDLQKPLACLKKWKHSAIARFEETQWAVLAPVFNRKPNDTIPHLYVSPRHPLPFLTWERAARPGACGQVFKVTIHPAHHDLSKEEAPGGVVAVKQLFSRKRGQFDAEVEVLRRISRENHTNKHLIKLLATYEHNEEFHLIFPYAPRDLETYWRIQNFEPIQSQELAHWLVNQCQGLAEGLTRIHKYGTESPTAFMKVDSKMASVDPVFRKNTNAIGMRWFAGRHGDIKPENILWFPQGSHGILKITDFGIARFTAQGSGLQRGKGMPPNSATFRSPECDDPNGELTGMCDVWALGCIYLVFVTWFTGGYKYVEQFAQQRKAIDEAKHGDITDSFFTIENGEARVKESVVKMMEKLKMESSKTMAEVVSIAQRKMLVIHDRRRDQETSNVLRPLAVFHNRRKSSNEISSDMGSLKAKIRPHVPGIRRSETQETWVSIEKEQ